MSTIRRLAATVALLLAAVVAGSALAAGTPVRAAPSLQPVFVVTGGGWGHGVGMSQWGAYGQAQAGRTFDQILATYYAGTELARSPTASVRVLIADGNPSATFQATGDLVVEDATGRRVRVRDGQVTLPASFRTTLRTTLGPERSTVVLTPPVRLRPTLGTTISHGGVARRGEYVVSASGTGLLVVNELSMEAYLRAVVPGEMPVGWPREALKAQAVAARTYAISSLRNGEPYDLHGDVRSQVYGGIPSENPATDRAVLETAGQILTYRGVPARTLYFSSSGGRTASALDVFGADVPYLRSVADPWDETSPHHAWEPKVFSARALGKAFGLGSPVSDVGPAVPQGVARLASSSSPSPTPARLRVTALDGASVDVGLNEIRARLGLASTRFRIGVLGLSTIDPPTNAGAVATVRGVARGVDAPLLERQLPDGSWQPWRRLRPRTDGSFRVDVRPLATTVLRLSGSSAAGPVATVVVPAT